MSFHEFLCFFLFRWALSIPFIHHIANKTGPQVEIMRNRPPEEKLGGGSSDGAVGFLLPW